MGLRDLSKFGDDSKALEWAHQAFAFDHVEMISQATWATTYRLEKQAARGPKLLAKQAYLKLIPTRFAGVAGRTQQLATRFVAQIPTVMACDDQRGWLLSADHGGTMLDYESPDVDLLAMIRSYARLQSKARHDTALLAAAPHSDVLTLPARLLDFLRPSNGLPDADGCVRADYFLGAEFAADALHTLQGYASLLTEFIKPALDLPDTINHGDLRPPNAAVGATGETVLLDWDDASVGPAGMSLHGMFGGCTTPIILLSGSALARAQARTPSAKTVRAYVQTLVTQGYASRKALLRSLPASMCAGMIQFILTFGRFPDQNNQHAIQDTMQTRITDLVDLCDLLATRDPALARQRAAFYEQDGAWRRARALLQDLVARNPLELALHSRLAVACQHEGDVALAEQLLQHVAQKSPLDAQAQQQLGTFRLERMELRQATLSLKKALALEPRNNETKAALARITDIQAMRKAAAVRKNVPILRYEPGDAQASRERPELAALGAEMFEKYGILQIDNAFPVELIKRLQKKFFERYSAYFQTENHPDTLHVGDMRYMLTVDMEDGFDDPQLLGSSTVLPIIKRVLGDECVLGAFTAVISLPGARDQRLHKDHPALFPDTPFHYAAPPFTAQIIIPLVPLDEFTGTTRFYKGSHKVKTDQSEALGHQDPMAGLGSCLLNDYRCAHRGLGNRSDLVRPILTMIFNRPWFRDYANYGNQPPLRLPQESYDTLPPELKPLVEWWMEEKKVVKQDQSALR